MCTGLNAHLGNIFQVYARADRWDRGQGIHAYPRYHEVLRELAKKHNTTAEIACAVFAALSPNVSYISNLRSAATILRTFQAGQSLESLSIPIYKQNQRKAWSILEGKAPLDIIRAPKTRNFFINLSNPNDPHAITIDGHMYCIWSLEKKRLKEIPDFDYKELAQDYRHCAKLLGLLPNQLQAICWFTWRRLHNLFTNQQPSLFNDDFELR